MIQRERYVKINVTGLNNCNDINGADGGMHYQMFADGDGVERDHVSM